MLTFFFSYDLIYTYILFSNQRSHMPTLFYEIFNKEVKLTSETLKRLKKELIELFEELKKEDNVDNIKVLRNKLSHLLEDTPEKLDKEKKKRIKKLHKILEEINDYLKERNDEKNQLVLENMVKKVEKKYKPYSWISEDKRDKYKESSIKKDTFEYEKEIIELQVELLKLQKYIKEKWKKLLVIFEWRDAAWKWWTIKRFREYLNPRWASVVALEKPTEKERSQWYFQRYVKNLPAARDMVFFDRSWYNRAGVEPVMWFVTKKEYERFLDEVTGFEKMLVNSGIKLIKFYFSVWKEEQAERFESRKTNPLKQYKLSPIDQYSQQLWDKYTLAEYRNFSNTHTKECPWVIINSNDKKRARLNAIKYVLNQFNYPWKIDDSKLVLDSDLVYSGEDKVKMLKEEIDIKKDLFE